jgi:hypothetical protein
MPKSQDFDRILPRGTIVEVVMNSRQVQTPDFWEIHVERSRADFRLRGNELKATSQLLSK